MTEYEENGWKAYSYNMLFGNQAISMGQEDRDKSNISISDLNSSFSDFYTSMNVFFIKVINVYLQEQFRRQRHYKLK